MSNGLKKVKRILILGDSGRGKTTLSEKISKKLQLQNYSTDDFYWKIRFSEPNDKEESIEKIKNIYENESWVVEGASNHLIKPGVERADIILDLKFKNIFSQWKSLIKRSKNRKYESLKDLFNLLIYVTRRRYGIGNNRDKIKNEILKPFSSKIRILRSYEEINSFINEL